MSTNQRTTSAAGASSTQMTALRWIASIVSALIVVQAMLAGQGVFGGEKSLLTGHGHLGNGIFALVAIQIVLSFLLFQKGQIGRNLLILSGVVMLLLFAQIGLGYSGRTSLDAAAWHLPNGVLLMGVTTVTAVLLWVRPNGATNSRQLA